MRKIGYFLLTVGIGLTTVSCAERFDFSGDKESNETKLQQAAAYTTTTDYAVPVVDGYITTVTYNGMTLARTSDAMTIKVPKQALANRANDGDLDVQYSPGVASASYTNLWQTVMFEDSKSGDNDYNDIIVHANYQTNGTTLTVGVQPIALGSTKDIRLGFKWSKGSEGEVIVAEDCRKDLFEGKTGFVNTEAYNKHYDGFEKTATVELPNTTDALSLVWFIEVAGERIYTANDSQYMCIDNNGMPFGFAITTAGTNSASTTWTPSAATQADWSKLIPSLAGWADAMPAQPTVPSGATSYADYSKTSSLSFDNVVVAAGENVAAGSPQTVKNFYVLGSVKFSSVYAPNCTIYVLPGGSIELPSGNITVNICNYGTMTISDGSNFSNGSVIKSATNLDASGKSFAVENDGTFAVFGDVKAKRFTIRSGASKIYTHSVDCSEGFYVTNSGVTYIDGALTAPEITMNSSGQLYADCAVRCANKLTITNSNKVFIKGYMNAKEIACSSTPTVYLRGGGLIETQNFTYTNVGNGAGIQVVGDDMGVFKADKMTLSGGTGIKNNFSGNIGVVYTTIVGGYNQYWALDWGNVLCNATSITAPKLDGGNCSPGYNTETVVDEGVCWVAYPLERQDITDCYNFDSWETATPDYTVKDATKVFDINATNPAEGAALKIFEMAK